MKNNLNLSGRLKTEIGKQVSNMPDILKSAEGMSSVNQFISAVPTNEDESNEQIIRRPIKTMKVGDLLGKKKMNKPIGKLTDMKPIMGEEGETTEATSAGSAGGYEAPLFSKPKRMDSMFKDEQPKKKVKGGFVYENEETGPNGSGKFEYETGGHKQKVFKDQVEEKWSEKYKRSIDCNNPKGFSQKAHCQGRKKKQVSEEKLKGGKADKKTFEDLVNKYKKHGKTISNVETMLKKQLNKGIKVEMEHTNDKGKAKEIAMDHLFEDPKYYDKLEKIETKEGKNSAKKSFLKDLQTDPDYLEFKKNKMYRDDLSKQDRSFGVPNAASNDPFVQKKKYSRVKDDEGITKNDIEEDENWTKKAQTNIDNVFDSLPKLKELKPYGLKYSVKGLKNLLLKKWRPDGKFGDNKWNRDEMPFPPELDVLNVIFQSKLAKYYFTQEGKKRDKTHYDWANLITKDSLDNFPIPESAFAMVIHKLTKDGDNNKIEATEATSSSSSGSYVTPAAWAKSTKKKDWRGASKTQIPGGKFVQVKKKCKTFPYCNQGDIKALNIFENKTLQKVITKISKEQNISESVIKTILAYEYKKK
jgi:hypothetical protein